MDIKAIRRKAKSTTVRLEQGLLKLKEKNRTPEFVRIRCQPIPCSSNQLCSMEGAIVLFSVTFAVHTESFQKHSVQFGLKGGRLRFCVQPELKDYHPKNKIPQVVKVVTRKQTERQRSMKGLSPFLADKDSTDKTEQTEVPQLSFSGNLKQPYWLFKSAANQAFDGVLDDIALSVESNMRKNCRCEYDFFVEEGDWLYSVQTHPNTMPVQALLAKMKINSYAAAKVKGWHEVVAKRFESVISSGHWNCSNQKQKKK